MSKKIFVVAGDRGGWNALEPPLIKAVDAGCEVHTYFVGICAQQFTEGKFQPDARFSVDCHAFDESTLTSFFTVPHNLAVLGASQTDEGAEAAFLAATNSTAPQLAMQDLYGSFIPTLALLRAAGQEKRVNRICVTDQFARDQILNQGYQLQPNIVVTGGPHFDKALAIKGSLPQLRQKLRQTLRVTDQAIVFLIAGQLNGTNEVVVMLLQTIEDLQISGRARIVIRRHPRATLSDKELTAQVISRLPAGMLLEAGDDIAASTDELLPAVDFVLSGYSTTNTFGILYQMPGVIYVKTPLLQKDFEYEKNLVKPPEAEIGAAWYVETAPDLTEAIAAVALGRESNKLEQIAAIQKQISHDNDGRATARVWEQMQQLLEQRQ